MKTRLLTAAVALPIIIASIILPAYFPQTIWLFVIIAALALAAGLFEFYSLTKKLELKADAGVGYVWAAALFVGFGLFFIALFVVLSGWWFRWVILGLSIVSVLHGISHARQSRFKSAGE